jgi:hypothetical protein
MVGDISVNDKWKKGKREAAVTLSLVLFYTRRRDGYQSLLGMINLIEFSGRDAFLWFYLAGLEWPFYDLFE